MTILSEVVITKKWPEFFLLIKKRSYGEQQNDVESKVMQKSLLKNKKKSHQNKRSMRAKSDDGGRFVRWKLFIFFFFEGLYDVLCCVVLFCAVLCSLSLSSPFFLHPFC